ncbi:MAG: hypothetical protein ABI388_02905 [Bacteroidia bacterium]
MIFISKYFISFFLCSLTLFSCTHKKSVVNTIQTTVAETPKIAFYTFTITGDTIANTLQAILKNKIIADGKLKEREQINAKNLPNCLKLVFLNGSTILKEVYIEHPLYKHVDVYGDGGKIESKDIKITNADFTVRIDKIKNLQEIIIYEYVSFIQTKNIITLKTE